MSEQAIQLTINGKAVSVPAQYGDWTLVRYLRQVAGLTGTKQSCDNEGTCGSCTVIINGQVRRSCREKLSALQGSQIETVESLGEMPDGIPHPLIQTVIQDGVFQCGYCSSGALMTAKALLDKKANPSADEIKRALSSIICRCSGLNRMEQSVQRAAAVLRGEASTGWTVEDTENEYRAINKLTGRLQYTDDLSFPDMLYGVALRSPLPHARVLKVDVSKAEQMPGVVRVLTAKDVPGRNR
ncbi:MAG: 2Fe-2S iron-sulfur cluster binding domain-containing protein, partial [Chloroflexi bacterium]|nr:2Fe-2S iron-sulfur cluster binding domain-containing protein [Chloroflexota bacterium]